MTVKVLICKGRLQNFIVRKCVNGQAEYSAMDVLSQNEWINKIYDCFLHKSETCKLEDEFDVDEEIKTPSTSNDFSTNEPSTTIEDTTTTTSYFSSSSVKTIPKQTITFPEKSEHSNCGKIKPIILFIMITIGIGIFI